MLVLRWYILENIFALVYLKLDFMLRFLRAGKSTYFIDPYTADKSVYISYQRDDLINNSADVLVVKL
jgi:hypothetical protein